MEDCIDRVTAPIGDSSRPLLLDASVGLGSRRSLSVGTLLMGRVTLQTLYANSSSHRLPQPPPTLKALSA